MPFKSPYPNPFGVPQNNFNAFTFTAPPQHPQHNQYQHHRQPQHQYQQQPRPPYGYDTQSLRVAQWQNPALSTLANYGPGYVGTGGRRVIRPITADGEMSSSDEEEDEDAEEAKDEVVKDRPQEPKAISVGPSEVAAEAAKKSHDGKITAKAEEAEEGDAAQASREQSVDTAPATDVEVVPEAKTEPISDPSSGHETTSTAAEPATNSKAEKVPDQDSKSEPETQPKPVSEPAVVADEIPPFAPDPPLPVPDPFENEEAEPVSEAPVEAAEKPCNMEQASPPPPPQIIGEAESDGRNISFSSETKAATSGLFKNGKHKTGIKSSKSSKEGKKKSSRRRTVTESEISPEAAAGSAIEAVEVVVEKVQVTKGVEEPGSTSETTVEVVEVVVEVLNEPKVEDEVAAPTGTAAEDLGPAATAEAESAEKESETKKEEKKQQGEPHSVEAKETALEETTPVAPNAKTCEQTRKAESTEEEREDGQTPTTETEKKSSEDMASVVSDPPTSEQTEKDDSSVAHGQPAATEKSVPDTASVVEAVTAEDAMADVEVRAGIETATVVGSEEKAEEATADAQEESTQEVVDAQEPTKEPTGKEAEVAAAAGEKDEPMESESTAEPISVVDTHGDGNVENPDVQSTTDIVPETAEETQDAQTQSKSSLPVVEEVSPPPSPISIKSEEKRPHSSRQRKDSHDPGGWTRPARRRRKSESNKDRPISSRKESSSRKEFSKHSEDGSKGEKRHRRSSHGTHIKESEAVRSGSKKSFIVEDKRDKERRHKDSSEKGGSGSKRHEDGHGKSRRRDSEATHSSHSGKHRSHHRHSSEAEGSRPERREDRRGEEDEIRRENRHREDRERRARRHGEVAVKQTSGSFFGLLKRAFTG